jgi:hypothetical protein|eukprot:SAG25_NODE_1390_length_3142_cov_20.821043_2_plen_50_part_00
MATLLKTSQGATTDTSAAEAARDAALGAWPVASDLPCPPYNASHAEMDG